MPKFCTKCGSALINGKCPNCDSGQPMGQQDHKPNDSLNQQEHEPHTASTEHYKEQGKAFFQNLLMIIKNPVDGLLVAAEDKNSKIGLIFMGIEAVLAGLFVFIFFSKIQGMIETLSSLSSSDVSGNLISFSFLIVGCLLNMGENMETFGNMFTNTSELTKPFMGGYLIREAIVVFLTSLIVSGLVYVLMRYMAHAEMNWFQSCQLVGLRSLGAAMG
ncbi:zinc ribbon domain-containing protein [Anaerostipes sp.]|nr:zinc ribbon domain-containing protein [Anaerostipes sp.]